MIDNFGVCGGGGWMFVMKIDGKKVFKEIIFGFYNFFERG